MDVSSTHIDEGGSYTAIKIAFALILIIEKKSLLKEQLNLPSWDLWRGLDKLERMVHQKVI